jgi:uncharacterized membrane protein
MKIMRLLCLLIVSLLAMSPLGSALAQEEDDLAFAPRDGRYNTIMVAGNDKIVTFTVENLGLATINNITFSAEEPSGWDIEFDPERVVALDSGDNERIDVTMEVPEAASTGDFMVAFTASGDGVSDKSFDYRVTVNPGVKEPKIELRALYPTLKAVAGEEFVFEVEFQYIAASITGEPLIFNLLTTTPPGWEISMTPPYEKEKKLTAISLKPGFTFTDKTRVVVSPQFWPLPDPGEYKVTLTADSGTLKDTVEFTAVITARYTLAVVPTEERYNTTATVGRNNYLSIQAGNLGTAPIDNIAFSSTKPAGWTVDFSPDKVDALEALSTQTVDVNIKPPPETIAGDYIVSIGASGTQTTARDIDIRVRVESPTIWGWVGVAIIVVVVAGLIGIFWRFSRR